MRLLTTIIFTLLGFVVMGQKAQVTFLADTIIDGKRCEVISFKLSSHYNDVVLLEADRSSRIIISPIRLVQDRDSIVFYEIDNVEPIRDTEIAGIVRIPLYPATCFESLYIIPQREPCQKIELRYRYALISSRKVKECIDENGELFCKSKVYKGRISIGR